MWFQIPNCPGIAKIPSLSLNLQKEMFRKPANSKSSNDVTKPAKKAQKVSSKATSLKTKENIQEEMPTPSTKSPIMKKIQPTKEVEFPEIGPYQCELCENVFETKFQFLDHVKSSHNHEIEAHLLEELESNILRSEYEPMEVNDLPTTNSPRDDNSVDTNGNPCPVSQIHAGTSFYQVVGGHDQMNID